KRLKNIHFVQFFRILLIGTSLCWSGLALAGGQQEEVLAASVQTSMQKSISDTASPEPIFVSEEEKLRWLTEMSARLAKRLPDTRDRVDFLKTVYYEAQRAGLDPQLVLGLIEVESAFRKYAVSSVGARGFMQVMPFWVNQIGTSEQNLFHLRTNLRYGCTILRHYLDIEKGDLYRALGRYNGSLGRPEYPNMVRAAWEKKWNFKKTQQVAQTQPILASAEHAVSR
ncbi:MAG: lytic transglycosylase subunit, partial [Rhodocyclales bacterium]|nr:lytic transglycosylase subunit [Rhodocyclales bacterium]